MKFRYEDFPSDIKSYPIDISSFVVEHRVNSTISRTVIFISIDKKIYDYIEKNIESIFYSREYIRTQMGNYFVDVIKIFHGPLMGQQAGGPGYEEKISGHINLHFSNKSLASKFKLLV